MSYSHFLFSDRETGEQFYVDAFDKRTAIATAKSYFRKPVFICIDDDIDFEMSGLDVY